jgi:hypothetical protein
MVAPHLGRTAEMMRLMAVLDDEEIGALVILAEQLIKRGNPDRDWRELMDDCILDDALREALSRYGRRTR